MAPARPDPKPDTHTKGEWPFPAASQAGKPNDKLDAEKREQLSRDAADQMTQAPADTPPRER